MVDSDVHLQLWKQFFVFRPKVCRGSRKDFGKVVKVWDRRCEVKRGERERLPSLVGGAGWTGSKR